MENNLNLEAEIRRHNLLIPLLQRQVISDAIINIDLSEAEYQSARVAFSKKHNLQCEDDFEALRKRNGWSKSDLKWQIDLATKITKYCEQKYLHKTEAYFLSRKNQLDKVVYSLLRVKDRFLAQELYWRIKNNEAEFSELSSMFSEGPEKNTKGIVGPVPMSQAHPVLAEALRISKPGFLMNPIQIEEWSIIARLETYSPATLDQTMVTRLSQELFDLWVNEEVGRRISEGYSADNDSGEE